MRYRGIGYGSAAGHMQHWSWRLGGSERLTLFPVDPHGFQLILMDLVCPYFPLFCVYLSFPETLSF